MTDALRRLWQAKQIWAAIWSHDLIVHVYSEGVFLVMTTIANIIIYRGLQPEHHVYTLNFF